MWNTKTQIINKIQCGIQKHKSSIKFYLWFVFLYSILDFIYDLCFCIPHWILYMICVFVFHIGFSLWFVFLYSTLDFIDDLCFCIPHWILYMICVLYFKLDFIYDLCFCIPQWILLMICVFVFHSRIQKHRTSIKSNVEYKNTNHKENPMWNTKTQIIYKIQCGIQKHKS
jgi:ABC-type dipeptide/oligopeptide/nickel transport system permease subunit